MPWHLDRKKHLTWTLFLFFDLQRIQNDEKKRKFGWIQNEWINPGIHTSSEKNLHFCYCAIIVLAMDIISFILTPRAPTISGGSRQNRSSKKLDSTIAKLADGGSYCAIRTRSPSSLEKGRSATHEQNGKDERSPSAKSPDQCTRAQNGKHMDTGTTTSRQVVDGGSHRELRHIHSKRRLKTHRNDVSRRYQGLHVNYPLTPYTHV